MQLYDSSTAQRHMAICYLMKRDMTGGLSEDFPFCDTFCSHSIISRQVARRECPPVTWSVRTDDVILNPVACGALTFLFSEQTGFICYFRTS